MDFVGDFLNKYNKLFLTNTKKNEVIIDVLFKVVKVEINQDQIKYKEGVITINCKPIVKLEIKLHQKDILEELKNKLPEVLWLKIH